MKIAGVVRVEIRRNVRGEFRLGDGINYPFVVKINGQRHALSVEEFEALVKLVQRIEVLSEHLQIP